jgi:hypothetical protein
MATNAYTGLDSAVDLARTQFSQDLRSNMTAYTNYVTQNAQAIQDQIAASKNSSFDKARTDLGRYMDLQHNVQLYEIRNSDVKRMADSLAANNNAIKSAVSRDKDVTRRQFEINEFYNYKKEQTAATLMGGVVMLTVILGLVIANKMEVLSAVVAGTLAGLIIVLFGLWAYYRPSANQDPRLWHRRVFTEDAKVAAPTACPGRLNFDITKQSDCLTNVEGKLSDLATKLDAQLTAYQTGDLSVPSPKSVCAK